MTEHDAGMPAGRSNSRAWTMLPGRRGLMLLLLLGVIHASPGSEAADRQTIGDFTVYLVLLPSRIIDDDRHRNEVRQMHGGAPNWGNPYHVVASVFDAGTGRPLEHADVRASVFSRESKLSGPRKQLEPMVIDGQRSWGNFFDLPAAAPFRIRLEIRRHPDGTVTTMEFRYAQRPHLERPAE